MTDVVIADDDVVAGVEAAVGAGVGFGTAAGVSMCPAKTETARVRLKIVTALIRRKGFISTCLLEMEKSLINLDEHKFSCKSAGDLGNGYSYLSVF